ncbi:MAG: hypothetical protein WA051_00715 [Minisyncoccia bacterium]
MKKILIIFILIIILGAGLWYFLFRAPTSAPVQTQTSSTPFGVVDANQTRVIAESKETGLQTNSNISLSVSKTNTPWKLLDGRIAGFSFITNSTSTKVVAVEKGTGHVYKSDFSQNLEKISNRTINRTVSAKITTTGKYALITKESDAGIPELYLLDLSSGNDPVLVAQGNVFQTAFSPSGKSFAYIQNSENSISLITKEISSLKSKTIWSSPIKGFIFDWPVENTFSVFTKPSNGAGGYSYTISPLGAADKIVGDLNSLSIKLDHTGKKYIESYFSNNNLSFVLNNGTEEIALLPMTLADKCAWANKDTDLVLCFTQDNLPLENMPDLWYQGVVRIHDTNLWKFDSKQQIKKLVSSWDLNNYDFDAVSIQISADDNFTGWIDKNDDSLWVMKLDLGN